MDFSHDPIREAFARAKQDIASLQDQVYSLSQDIAEIKSYLHTLLDSRSQEPTYTQIQPTNTQSIPTSNLNELSKHPLEAVKSPYIQVSTGNDGVPTNQPTNQQTNQHIGNEGVNINTNFNPTHNSRPTHPKIDEISHLSRASEILNSLDALKKEIRAKFKRLTNQEMMIFSNIYELHEAGYDVDYTTLARQTNLSEISIRDYIHKIIKKGVPIVKQKRDNKSIVLLIPDELKRIATLATIKQLREL